MVNNNCLTKKILKKIKTRNLNKTIKNISKRFSIEPNKYLSYDELYTIGCKNDILNYYKKFKINIEKQQNPELIKKFKKMRDNVEYEIGLKNIKYFLKIFKNNKSKTSYKLIDTDINYYIYKQLDNNYNNYYINYFCKKYDLLNIDKLSSHFDYFNIQNIDFNPNKTKISFCVDFIGNRNFNLFVFDIFNPKNIEFIDLNKNNESLLSMHNALNNSKQLSPNYYWVDNETIIYISYNNYYNNTLCYTYHIPTKKRRLIYKSLNNKMVGLSATYSNYYYILYVSTYNSDEIYLLDINNQNIETSKKKINLISKPIFKNKQFVTYEYIDHIDATWYIMKKDKYKYTFMKTKDFKTYEILFKKNNNFYIINNILYFNNYFIFFIKNKGNSSIELYNNCDNFKKTLFSSELLCNLKDNCSINILNSFIEQNKIIFYSSSFTTLPKLYCLEIPKIGNAHIGEIILPPSKAFNRKFKYNEKTFYLKNNSIMVTLIYKKGLKLNNCKCLLYGYGSYGDSYDATYNANKFLTLCDDDFLVAIAHVSGDGKLGFNQRYNGMFLNKKNTFSDFIYIIEEFLFQNNYTSKEKLAIWGRSAGGLLIGSVINLKPEICNLAILGVPFLTPNQTMGSDKNPLGFESHSEWGNPLEEPYKSYIQSYNPYDNINPCSNYPNIFLYSNLNDTLVPYKEPYNYYTKMKNEVNVFKNNQKNIYLHMTDKFGHIQGSSVYDINNIFLIIFACIKKHIK